MAARIELTRYRERTAMGKILVLQHHRIETLGTIADALDGAGFSYDCVRTFAGEPVPRDLAGADGLVIMGGPMGVYETDRYPFIRDELALIESALKDEKPILGVCLGSQLLAATLGASVRRGSAKELGWYPVRMSAEAKEDRLLRDAPETFMALHWHGDVFDLPRGAVALASSQMTPLQAFRYGEKAYGFLFHMEVTAEAISAMVREFSDEVREAGADGQRIIAEGERHLPSLSALAARVFSRWAALAATAHG